jgi:hypothetical protein
MRLGNLSLGVFLFVLGCFLLIGIGSIQLAFSSFDTYFTLLIISSIVGGIGMVIAIHTIASDMFQQKDTSSSTASRAFWLNFVFWGVGYLYLKRKKTFGLLLIIGIPLYYLGWLVSYFLGWETEMLGALTSILYGFAFGYDAYQEAKTGQGKT